MTEEEQRARIFADLDEAQGALAAWGVGAVAGALLWKQHRVWGFILGGMLVANLYTLATK